MFHKICLFIYLSIYLSIHSYIHLLLGISVDFSLATVMRGTKNMGMQVFILYIDLDIYWRVVWQSQNISLYFVSGGASILISIAVEPIYISLMSFEMVLWAI
jgi:hypothetical protein